MNDSNEHTDVSEGPGPSDSHTSGATSLDGTFNEPTRAAETGDEFGDDDVETTLSFLLPSSRTDALGRIGDYDVLAIEGRGGMGIVLKAFDNGLSRVVAVKVPNPQLASSRKFRARFLREGRSVAAISHPNVLTIHAVGEHNDLPYLVMEYIAGRTLRERIALGAPMQAGDIARIGAQIAEGLEAAHRRGVIHRDIKPSNIMLEDGVERVKITDFGLARAALDQSGLTSVGHVVGTPAFMAPEQLRDGKTDARSDLFSLGCVMYAMVAGHSPFRGSHTLDIIHKVSELSPPGLDEIEPGLPAPLSAIVGRLLEKDPDRRYQSAGDVAADLTRLLMKLDLESQASADLHPGDAPAAVSPPDGGRGRRGKWLAVVIPGIAALLVLASSPWWFPGRDRATQTAGGARPGPEQGVLPGTTPAHAASPVPDERSVDRRAAEWVLEIGGSVGVSQNGVEQTIRPGDALPEGEFSVLAVDLTDNDRAAADGLERLEGLTQLRDLKLFGVAVTDDDLKHIAGLVTLERLDLFGSKIGDSGLDHIAGLEHLQSLSIHETGVTDAGLARIAGLRELQALNLGMTRISDDGLRHLSAMTGLRWLQLSGTRVTDVGLKYLSGLYSLSELYLHDVAVTQSGVASLHDALPDCMIYSDEQLPQER